jgi:hypothetical protein
MQEHLIAGQPVTADQYHTVLPPCTQCGEPTVGFMGPVCDLCCRSNHRHCNGRGKTRAFTREGRRYWTEVHGTPPAFAGE